MRKILETLWFQPYTPFVILAVVIWAAASFVYPPIQHYIQSKNLLVGESLIPTPSPSALASEDALLAAVAKLIVLPSDERPQIITISDIEKFKDQPFFKHAKNGDILLIYPKNKKAILYDPKENRIIDTAPIASGEASQPATGPGQLDITNPSPPPTSTPSATSETSPTPTP